MKKNNLKMSYDSDADVLSLEQSTRTVIDHAQEMGNLIVHFSKRGQPVLIEILDASSLLKHQPKALRETLRHTLARV